MNKTQTFYETSYRGTPHYVDFGTLKKLKERKKKVYFLSITHLIDLEDRIRLLSKPLEQVWTSSRGYDLKTCLLATNLSLQYAAYSARSWQFYFAVYSKRQLFLELSYYIVLNRALPTPSLISLMNVRSRLPILKNSTLHQKKIHTPRLLISQIFSTLHSSFIRVIKIPPSTFIPTSTFSGLANFAPPSCLFKPPRLLER